MQCYRIQMLRQMRIARRNGCGRVRGCDAVATASSRDCAGELVHEREARSAFRDNRPDRARSDDRIGGLLRIEVRPHIRQDNP